MAVSAGRLLLAVLLAAAIFATDTWAPLGIAVAVLYVLVILLLSADFSRRATAYACIGCALLAIASHLLQHRSVRPDPALARLVIALSAIAAAGVLVNRNQAAQLRAQRAERELREMLDSIPTLVMRAQPDGTVLTLNAHWRNQGFDELALRRNWLQMVHPDDVAAATAKRERSIATGKPYEMELRLRRADGEYRWLLVRVVTVADETGQVMTRYSAATDIEDRKRAETNLQQAQATMARVSRMTTLGEFTTWIAHEVNQPLATIVANGGVCLRLLERDQPDLAEVREATRDIVNDACRASEIIKRIRALASRRMSGRSSMDLNQVIREVVPLVRGELLRHGLSLRLDLEPAVPRVWGDVVELQQVLINLVANGMEASAPGPDSSADLAICTRHGDAGGVLIAVVDGGAGLSDAAAGRMFDAFFTTKPNGMGMGLAICRSIVEAHGGRIWASNNAGRGATVHIALPRHPDIES